MCCIKWTIRFNNNNFQGNVKWCNKHINKTKAVSSAKAGHVINLNVLTQRNGITAMVLYISPVLLLRFLKNTFIDI